MTSQHDTLNVMQKFRLCRLVHTHATPKCLCICVVLVVVLLLIFSHGIKQIRNHSPGTDHKVADGAHTFVGETPPISAAIPGYQSIEATGESPSINAAIPGDQSVEFTGEAM